MYKLEELSIADLKVALDYALEEWDNAVNRVDQEGIDYWYTIQSVLELELDDRVKQLFKP